nr:DUF6056 family protein [Streptomyces sp. NBC_00995]
MARYLSSPVIRMRLLVSAAGALVVASGALLAVGAFVGLYLRPTSDDYCGAWKARDMGVLGITRDFYETQNGRLANAFLNGVVYSHGMVGAKILPSVILAALTLGLLLAARVLGQALNRRAPGPVVLATVFVAEMLLFFAGTRPYQVLLWAPGTITHTLPGVILVWSVLLAVAAGRHGGRMVTWTSVGCAVLMGMVIGTLSEPFTAVSGVFVGAAGILLLIPRLRPRTWYPFRWCAGWCVGLVAGFTVLYLSPGARLRRAHASSPGSPLSSGQLRGAVRDWLHVWHSIGGAWVYLAALAVGLVLGLAISEGPRRAAEPDVAQPPGSVAVQRLRAAATGGSRLWGAALVGLPVLLVFVSSFAVIAGLRMGSGPAGWTYGRAWANFLLPMIIVLVGYGVLTGRLLAGRLARSVSGRALPVVLLAGAAATATCVGAAAQLVPVVQGMTAESVVRSRAWDHQDSRIRQEVAEGATVVAYHPLYIGKLGEPFLIPDYSHDWAAQCVSRYYRVTHIRK